jgi:hypothetical protein
MINGGVDGGEGSVFVNFAPLVANIPGAKAHGRYLEAGLAKVAIKHGFSS